MMNKAEREKKLKILLPVLLVIALFVWMPNFQGSDSKDKRAGLENISGQDLDIGNLLASIPSERYGLSAQESAYGQWGRNPFVPEGWEPKKEEPKVDEDLTKEILPSVNPLSEKDFILNGIFWNEKKPSALINDEVVGIGSKIKGFVVQQITKEKVSLNDGVQRIELRIREPGEDISQENIDH